MNKKNVRWFLIAIFVSAGIMMSYMLIKKLEQKEKLEIMQQKFSNKGLVYLINHPLNERKPTILSLFHPSCDFCQTDAEQFRKSHAELEDFEVLWISYDNKDSIRKFSKDYGLDTLPNMHFAFMDIEVMLKRYGNVKFPTFLAYDNSGQLIQKWVGMTKPQEIIAAYN